MILLKNSSFSKTQKKSFYKYCFFVFHNIIIVLSYLIFYIVLSFMNSLFTKLENIIHIKLTKNILLNT